jgi:cell division protein FtsB
MVAKHKEIKKEVIFTTIISILVFIIVSFLIASNFRINQRRTDLKDQLQVLQNQYQSLLQQKEELESQTSQASGQDYLEKEARENFNLKKPGEEVVTVLPLEEGGDKTTEQRVWWNPFTW